MSPYVFLGLVFLHAGEEFILILPLVLLTGAWLLMAWASKGDTADVPAHQDEPNAADEAEHDSPQPHETLSA